jgi:imidazolonepropionase-like amidohydrolase
MQNKYSITLILMIALFCTTVQAQETVYPVGPQKNSIVITHATIHIGNGSVLNDASILFNKGKIVSVGTNIAIPEKDITIVDGTGKQVYPGMILPASNLGLREIGAGVRGSNDFQEIGENNASIHSIVSYNTDSKIINILRSNGILLAHVAPEGELIEGQSSVVQLDAWNYEDAAYKRDIGQFVTLPSFIVRTRGGRGMRMAGASDPLKDAMDKVATIKKFFTEAKAYLQESTHVASNLKFEAVRGLFEGKQKLFVRANEVKQILVAIDLGKTFGFNTVIVGGSESAQIANILVENNIPVILDNEHALPTTEDDDIDQFYKLPAQLAKAGVLIALNDANDQAKQMNMSFNAGTAAAYGLGKEAALSAVTLNTAKILGIDNTTGSLEVGKDANILISNGDLLDMRGNQIIKAFIQGRDISLDNKQKQLNDRFKSKYKIKD